MNILLLGGGGREHALADALARSPLCDRLVVAPGNGGISEIATCESVDILDSAAVVRLAQRLNSGLVVIGPEAPLAAGVADALGAAGIPAFGPSAAAARLESSKAFAKEVCDACGAPTAAWSRYDDAAAAAAAIRSRGAPIVVKADGLAAGKGVTVAMTEAQALAAAAAIFDDRVGAASDAGPAVVLEDCLVGEEVSVFALCDGETVRWLGSAQDHKRAFDGDEGPNTGGMGAYAPAPILTDALRRDVTDRILSPVVAEMAARGAPFRGVLYAGLMLTEQGPSVIEFNARFGDPETQALLLLLDTDITQALCAAAHPKPSGAQSLDQVDIRFRDGAAMTVVMAARGYPDAYAKGEPIGDIALAVADPSVRVFHAGTRLAANQIVSNGGRVLNVSAVGSTLRDARDAAYRALDQIDWPGGFARRDIGWRVLDRPSD